MRLQELSTRNIMPNGRHTLFSRDTSPVESAPVGAAFLRKAVDAVSAATVCTMTLPVPSARPRIREMDHHELEPGDVLLIGDDNYPGWLVMQHLLCGADYAHCCMYMGNGDVIDSDTDKGVTRHPLKDMLECHRLQVLRPAYKTGADRQAALDYCESQKGKPFDLKLCNLPVPDDRCKVKQGPPLAILHVRHIGVPGEGLSHSGDITIDDTLIEGMKEAFEQGSHGTSTSIPAMIRPRSTFFLLPVP